MSSPRWSSSHPTVGQSKQRDGLINYLGPSHGEGGILTSVNSDLSLFSVSCVQGIKLLMHLKHRLDKRNNRILLLLLIPLFLNVALDTINQLQQKMSNVTAQGICSLKIMLRTTTIKRLHFHFSTVIHLTWIRILKWIFCSMHVCREEWWAQSEVKYQLLKTIRQIYQRCSKVLLILQKPWRL